ncbi:MAG: acetyl-CoA carboxylase biotin carboxyl carrier protein subunit [Saprospiraceae bacterium]|nr:acetyl-CoA carboxylase biotin carboxyl carrier protein subunit [Saprospiraceae bacterium]
MYKVLIKNQEIEVSQKDLDELNISFDNRNNCFQILKDGKSHRIYPIDSSKNGKSQRMMVDDLDIETVILDHLDQQVESMGLSDIDDHKSMNITAPMPGLILDIMCEEGEEIEAGKSILILEAMKMENVIKAEGNGTIVKIHNSVGESVEKGQLIIEIE